MIKNQNDCYLLCIDITIYSSLNGYILSYKGILNEITISEAVVGEHVGGEHTGRDHVTKLSYFD